MSSHFYPSMNRLRADLTEGHITTDEFRQIASAEFGCNDLHIDAMVRQFAKPVYDRDYYEHFWVNGGP